MWLPFAVEKPLVLFLLPLSLLVVPKQSGSPTPFVGPAVAAKIREVFPALGMQFLYIFGFFLNNGMGLCSYCLLVISRVSDPPTALCTLLSLHDPSPLNFFFL